MKVKGIKTENEKGKFERHKYKERMKVKRAKQINTVHR